MRGSQGETDGCTSRRSPRRSPVRASGFTAARRRSSCCTRRAPTRASSFVRTDTRDAGRDPGALERGRRRPRLATTLGRGDASVRTVEHLLGGALRARHRQRAHRGRRPRAARDGRQRGAVRLPDPLGGRASGSASAGASLRIRRPIEIRDGDRAHPRSSPRATSASATPSTSTTPRSGRQELELAPLDAERFEREISARAHLRLPARRARALGRPGCARGGSLDNTVVLDDTRVVNPQGLRWPDEFVRHKVLDLCGDLALLGVPLVGPRPRRARRPLRCTSGWWRRSSRSPTPG